MEQKTIVILGAGIVGVSTAYFLTCKIKEAALEKNYRITLVDQVGIAPCASGNAAGFLSRNFSRGTTIEELSEKGFDLHESLAKKLNGEAEYGYRRVKVLDVVGSLGKSHNKKEITWLENIQSANILGDKSDSAQVHPKKLCELLWKSAKENGCEMVVGKVIDIKKADENIEGNLEIENKSRYVVRLESEAVLQADNIVLCLGPWTHHARRYALFADVPSGYFDVYGLRAHSLVFKTKDHVPGECLFLSVRDGKNFIESDIEVYPRPDGTIYVSGESMGSGEVISISPEEKELGEPESYRKLEQVFSRFTKSMEKELVVKRACYLPIRNRGVPIIGEIAGVPDVYMAAGHGCWGILNGPITGQIVSELVLKIPSNQVDIKEFY
ncbi:putative oxidoreductase [Zancudomyces culisetae]|uniref:Putative oxidoreductase n=1 Tax=Zancudomyces culisetae TaxID=1213189 RepID=A0A1R1PDZ7_ZANCU|nr:putative oxidoreductase [Zancudomyces culisetae]|eukprot:OMH79186.1 putative oxidoreductase [Zancudomyces culisetae]